MILKHFSTLVCFFILAYISFRLQTIVPRRLIIFREEQRPSQDLNQADVNSNREDHYNGIHSEFYLGDYIELRFHPGDYVLYVKHARQQNVSTTID